MPVAPITRTEHVGRYRGYHLVTDWAPYPMRLRCVGYRASSVPAATGPLLEPPECRDGEAPHFDSEAAARAAIDATFVPPGAA